MRRILPLLAPGGPLSAGYTYSPPRHPTNHHRPTPKPMEEVAPDAAGLPGNVFAIDGDGTITRLEL